MLCVAVLVFSTWTYARNSVWKSDVSLWNDCVEKSRPHVSLGLARMRRGNYRGAISLYKRALQINSEDSASHNNLGIALAKLGKLEDAVHHFSEALRINPGYSEARRNLEFSLKGSANPDDDHKRLVVHVFK